MADIESVIDKYGDTLYRICLMETHSEADAEDAVQETFLKYIKKKTVFSSETHEKAWLIRVAINQSRDIIRKNKVRVAEDIDALSEKLSDATAEDNTGGSVIRILLSLPDKFSRVMILHFVEDLDYKTIAGIIKKSESAVKMRVKKGRELFIQEYKKEMGLK